MLRSCGCSSSHQSSCGTAPCNKVRVVQQQPQQQQQPELPRVADALFVVRFGPFSSLEPHRIATGVDAMISKQSPRMGLCQQCVRSSRPNRRTLLSGERSAPASRARAVRVTTSLPFPRPCFRCAHRICCIYCTPTGPLRRSGRWSDPQPG